MHSIVAEFARIPTQLAPAPRTGAFFPAVCIGLVFLASAGCDVVSQQEPHDTIVVFGAASTTNALDELREQFQQVHDVSVRTSYAASSTLAQQIVNGADAHVFVSANVKWADDLDRRGLVRERHDLLRNRLVVVVRADTSTRIDTMEDLLVAEIRHLALADTAAVPAGVYAKQALSKLGLWDRLKKKVVAGADVRQTLTYVETGAAEAAIVYATDARIGDKVRVALELPADLTEPIRYPIVLLNRGDANPAVRSFYDYLNSPEAATVFTRHGFSVGSDGPDPAANLQTDSNLATSAEWAALRLSFQVAACAALAALPLAIGIAYVLARYRFRGRWLAEAVVNLPLVLPPVVTGYLLLVCFAPRGPIGSILDEWFGIRIVFTWTGAVLAAMVVSFPLMVRAIRLAFQSVDRRLEMAARSLGASRTTTFFTVTLPLARSGVIAGWLLAFARSLGEFGATIMIAGNIEGLTRTIPLEIYSLANRPGGIGQSWRLVGLSVLLACGALAVSEWLERRQSRHDPA